MTSKPYGMICPITRVCEILEPRWTIAVIVALWAGATKFNEIRREVGSVSPALLSRRLKELEELGLVDRIEDTATGQVSYTRTEAAIAMEPALDALGHWAQRYVSAEIALCNPSVSNLMWNLRKRVVAEELPRKRAVIQFRFSDPGLDYDTYWVVVNPGAPVEICTSIPGFDIDVFVETISTSLLGVILGRTTIAREVDLDHMFLSGDAHLVRTIDRWLVPAASGMIEGIMQMPDNREWSMAAE